MTNIDGLKKSCKGMTRNIRHTENSIEEEKKERNQDSKKLRNLDKKLTRIIQAKNNCSERIRKLKKERDKRK